MLNRRVPIRLWVSKEDSVRANLVRAAAVKAAGSDAVALVDKEEALAAWVCGKWALRWGHGC